MKKHLFLLLFVSMGIGTTCAQLQLNGNGTEADPYLINSASDFSSLSSWVRAGNTCENQFFKLTRSISSNKLIGDENNAFSGVFDGNNDTITCKGGVFPKISNATIKNLTIKITSCRTIRNSTSAGGLICVAVNSTISSCYVIGGDLIYEYMRVTDSDGNRYDPYARMVGGIVGSASNTTITNCGNYVNISRSGDYYLDSKIAGIVADSKSTNVTSCFNKGNMSQKGDCETANFIAMGIGGSSCNKCFNTGDISVIIGNNGSTKSNGKAIARGISTGSVQNSYNRGNVSALDQSMNTWMATASGIGGASCSNCYNTGEISAMFSGQIGSQIDADEPALYGTNCYSWYNVAPNSGMANKLNASGTYFYQDNTPNINDGYPILDYQRLGTPIFSISVNAENGQIQGGGEYEYGAFATLTAVPNEGYVFSHWSDGNTENPRTITVTEDATYTAIFVAENITEDHFAFVSHQNGSTIGLAALATHQTLEYSTDGTTWNNMTTATTVTLNSGDMLYMRGVLSDDNTSSDYTQFSMSGSIAASGNINYLWNYQNINEPLKVYCGMSMFKDCSALVKAPELPSTSLAEHCYQYMFQNCTSLLSAPELPATTLAKSCYLSMFQECTSLTSAPELPALTLANHCYWRMFRGCTSLATAPELPATILTMYCYNQMFMQTAITRAPELRAPVLADNCYYGMFYQCSQLNYIQCFATDVSASGCTEKWVQGVATSCTFVKNSTMNKWVIGNNGIPTGWMTEDYVVLNEYEVTFVDWDGTILKTEHVLEGTSATAPENPSREWHTFTGWDKDFSIITTNLIVTAQYKEGQTLDYTLLFTNGNDNSEIATRFIALELPAPPTIAGFLFQKWVIVGGDLDGVIEIQAIYSYQGAATSTPAEVVINSANPTRKLIRNGNVYILMGDKTYTVTGQEVR